jgi:hypothetical protein
MKSLFLGIWRALVDNLMAEKTRRDMEAKGFRQEKIRGEIWIAEGLTKIAISCRESP